MSTITSDDEISIYKTNILLHFPGSAKLEGLQKNFIAAAESVGGRKLNGGGDNFKRKYFMPYVYSRSPSKERK